VQAVGKHAASEFNGATLAQWIEWESGLSPEQYAQRMALGGAWGGQIELALLARGIARDITVYKEDAAALSGFALEHTFPASSTPGVRPATLRPPSLHPPRLPRAAGDPCSPARPRGPQLSHGPPVRVVYNGAHYDALLPRGARTAVSAAAKGGGGGGGGEGGALGELSGAALVDAALKAGGARRYGQLVEGHPVPAEDEHTATVIFMHGLGDSGFGWAPVATQLAMPHVKFLFPTAPVLPPPLVLSGHSASLTPY